MRKVWLVVITVAILTVAMALPAAAAVPAGNDCNKTSIWNFFSGPSITQSTVPSTPKDTTPVENPGDQIQCKLPQQISKPDLNEIITQLPGEFVDCLKGLLGNGNSPASNSNCNQ